jgi:hypothetical protein
VNKYDPTGCVPKWINDFLRGLKDGFIGTFTGILYSVMHPFETLRRMLSPRHMLLNLLDPFSFYRMSWYILTGNFYKAGYTYGGILGEAIIVLIGQAVFKIKVKYESQLKISNLADNIKNWLGKDARAITNKAGDKIFLSKDGLRRVRFDIKRPYPHTEAHVHIEELVNGKWKTTRIFPKK